MLYTNTEIDLLRLCGWCKDLPVKSKNINREDLSYLLLTGQLRASRNGISIRVTEKGKATLDNLGYSYEYDSKSRGVGTFLTRRLQTAELMLFLFQGKTDVFCSSVPDRNSPLSFLMFHLKPGIYPLQAYPISENICTPAKSMRLLLKPSTATLKRFQYL